MNLIITGGGGFLGSSLVKKLIDNNNNVLVFSKNSSNLGDYITKCKFITSYVDEICSFEEEIKSFCPDMVIHFGWSGGNSNLHINESTQFFDNVPHSIKFLELVSTLDKKPRFMGVGSFAEYGDQEIAYSEDHEERPKNFYGLSKKIFREYSELFCKQNSIDWSWIRPCFIYGPNDVSTRLIPRVIQKMIDREKVHLDDCNVLVDYLYIDDFSDFVYELIVLNSKGIYNICSGEKYKLKDIIKKIKDITHSDSELLFDASMDNLDKRSVICGDNMKIKLATNKRNFVDLNEGLKLTIQHIKNK